MQVPIIKAWFGGLGNSAQPLPIDISIGVANGAAAVRMVQQAVVDLPPLRPLCLVLKALLRETGALLLPPASRCRGWHPAATTDRCSPCDGIESLHTLASALLPRTAQPYDHNSLPY